MRKQSETVSAVVQPSSTSNSVDVDDGIKGEESKAVKLTLSEEELRVIEIVEMGVVEGPVTENFKPVSTSATPQPE